MLIIAGKAAAVGFCSFLVTIKELRIGKYFAMLFWPPSIIRKKSEFVSKISYRTNMSNLLLYLHVCKKLQVYTAYSLIWSWHNVNI